MDLKQADVTLRRTDRASDLCSVTEAAMRTRMSSFTIWKWIREGQLQAYGRPHCLRVAVGDILLKYTPKDKENK